MVVASPALPGRRWFQPFVVVAFAAGCRHQSGSLPAGACPSAREDAAPSNLVVRRVDGRPNLVLVTREGDPRAAAAAWVATGGSSYASTAVAAVVEARLQKSGFSLVDSRADRDSFRVRALVDSPERAADFARSVQRALAAPITTGSPELGLVYRRLAALRRHPLEAPIAASISRCSGELGAIAADIPADPTTADAVANLDSLRAAAYASSRVAFAVVGPSAVTSGASDGWSASDKWPRGSQVEGAWLGDDDVGAFAPASRGPLRVNVAVTTHRPEGAIVAAARAGAPEGTLAARLRGLLVPFRVIESAGTVRPHGGCATVTLEALRAPASGGEEAAALAATVARQELEIARAVPDLDAADDMLPIEGNRAVRAATDPREAAELAALWSLAQPSSEDRDHVATALLLPPATDRETPDPAAKAQASGKRFGAALERFDKAWSATVVERRERVERGQGEVWMLVASPCGVLAEGETDAGTSALALMTALATRGHDTQGVTLEPWITTDGIGLIAHAERAPGESSLAQAVRVAEEAARTLSVYPFGPQPFATARAALLGRVGEGISADGRAMDALAGALVPGHPSWLAPLGSWDEIAKTGAETASLRWAAVTGGPLRVAVLANENQEQVDRAARLLDRWIVRTASQPRACAPAETSPSGKAGTVTVPLPTSPPLAQATIGIGMPPQGSPDGPWAELTLAALGGADGWLAKAFASASLAASAQARLVGGARTAALVVDLRAPESSLEGAVAQTRALFERLRQGAMTTGDFERSASQRERWELEASLDPRKRLVDLWRDARPAKPAALSLEGWRTWAASALRDDKLVVVLAKPRH